MMKPSMDATKRQAYLDALYEALMTGARRVVFQDRIIEFNTPDEIKSAIAELNRVDAAADPASEVAKNAPPRQIRMVLNGGSY
jgi:hypothetical protein